MRSWIIAVAASAVAFALTACDPGTDYANNYLQSYARPDATPGNFFACHGYGCKYVTRIALSEEEWRSVRARLAAPAPDAATERRQISRAVARMEWLVGQRTGTTAHQRYGWNGGDPTQLDCIDQSVNTWTYLTLLDRVGLLRFHSVGGLAHSGTLLASDVRNSATLVVKATGERFAIDPQLVDAAQPPPVLPVALWAGDWPPEIPDAYKTEDAAGPSQ